MEKIVVITCFEASYEIFVLKFTGLSRICFVKVL